jgi:ERCC4-type nuclease
MINMIVDTREPEKIKKLALKTFTDSKLGALETGDFYFEDTGLIVERKDIGDFIASYKSGHMQKQLIAMKEYPFPVLVISGKFSDLHFKGGFNHTNINSYLGMLSAITLNNVKWCQVENDAQLIKVIELMQNRIKEGKVTEFTGEVKFVNKTLSSYVKFVSIIPGISIVLAERIKITYPTINNLIGALENDTFTAKGIGKSKEEAIKNFFKELELIH